jgi:hypothetical protein
MSKHPTSEPGAQCRPSQTAGRPRRTARRPRPARWCLRAALAVCLCAALPTPGLALLHYDPTQPPFDNSVHVPALEQVTTGGQALVVHAPTRTAKGVTR